MKLGFPFRMRYSTVQVLLMAGNQCGRLAFFCFLSHWKSNIGLLFRYKNLLTMLELEWTWVEHQYGNIAGNQQRITI